VASEQERLAAVKQNLDRIGQALKEVDQELKKQQAQPTSGERRSPYRRRRSA
jgi:hypothetical protein